MLSNVGAPRIARDPAAPRQACRVKVLSPASGEGTWIVQTVRPNQVHSRLMVGRQQRADDGLELGVGACPASEDVHDLADKLLITVTVLHEKPLSKLGE